MSADDDIAEINEVLDSLHDEADTLRAQRDSLLAVLGALRAAAVRVQSLRNSAGLHWDQLQASADLAEVAIAAVKAQEKG